MEAVEAVEAAGWLREARSNRQRLSSSPRALALPSLLQRKWGAGKLHRELKTKIETKHGPALSSMCELRELFT